MRSSLKTFIAVAAALLVVPSFASADDVGGGDDLQEVISRMSDLEQQLKATNDALAASNAKVDQQQKMISKLGTSNQSGPMLALSKVGCRRATSTTRTIPIVAEEWARMVARLAPIRTTRTTTASRLIRFGSR